MGIATIGIATTRATLFVAFFISLHGISLRASELQLPKQGYQLIQQFPHDTQRFTQGLTVYNNKLIECTGLRNQSAIYSTVFSQLNSSAIKSPSAVAPKQYFGEGCASYKQQLIWLNWQAEIATVYRLSDFKTINTFRYQGEGWGITHRDNYFVMSNGSHILQLRDDRSFALKQSIPILIAGKPLNLINELEAVGDYLFANIWQSPLVIIFNKKYEAIGQIDLSPLIPSSVKYSQRKVANGIAYDASSGSFYISGKEWPSLFQIKLQAPFVDSGLAELH